MEKFRNALHSRLRSRPRVRLCLDEQFTRDEFFGYEVLHDFLGFLRRHREFARDELAHWQPIDREEIGQRFLLRGRAAAACLIEQRPTSFRKVSHNASVRY